MIQDDASFFLLLAGLALGALGFGMVCVEWIPGCAR